MKKNSIGSIILYSILGITAGVITFIIAVIFKDNLKADYTSVSPATNVLEDIDDIKKGVSKNKPTTSTSVSVEKLSNAFYKYRLPVITTTNPIKKNTQTKENVEIEYANWLYYLGQIIKKNKSEVYLFKDKNLGLLVRLEKGIDFNGYFTTNVIKEEKIIVFVYNKKEYKTQYE